MGKFWSESLEEYIVRAKQELTDETVVLSSLVDTFFEHKQQHRRGEHLACCEEYVELIRESLALVEQADEELRALRKGTYEEFRLVKGEDRPTHP